MEVNDDRKSSLSRDISAEYMKVAWPGESAGTISNNEQLKSSIIEDKFLDLSQTFHRVIIFRIMNHSA